MWDLPFAFLTSWKIPVFEVIIIYGAWHQLKNIKHEVGKVDFRHRVFLESAESRDSQVSPVTKIMQIRPVVWEKWAVYESFVFC